MRATEQDPAREGRCILKSRPPHPIGRHKQSMDASTEKVHPRVAPIGATRAHGLAEVNVGRDGGITGIWTIGRDDWSARHIGCHPLGGMVVMVEGKNAGRSLGRQGPRPGSANESWALSLAMGFRASSIRAQPWAMEGREAGSCLYLH